MHHTTFKTSGSGGGFTLLFAVLISSLLLTIGIAIFNITFKEVILASQARESQFSFYAADSGLECALLWDKQHPGFSTGAFGSFTAAASGTFNEGLIDHWKFDDPPGSSIALDSSGSNNGTLVNMNPATDWVTGQVRGGLDFDGVNDQVSIPNVSHAERFSVSFWLYPRSYANYTQQFRAANAWGSFVFHTTDTGAVYVGTDWDQGGYPNGAIATGIPPPPPPPPGGCWPTPGIPRLPETWGGM